MGAVLVDVAEAVTVDLRTAVVAGEFDGIDFDPVRSYGEWKDEQGDIGCLRVDVVPIPHLETDNDARESVGYAVSVDIVIRKWFGQKDSDPGGKIELAEIDRLVLLTEEIHELFVEARLTTYDEASWRETSIRACAPRDHLQNYSMFLGVIRVTFDVSKRL
jgi:hypothetical protein